MLAEALWPSSGYRPRQLAAALGQYVLLGRDSLEAELDELEPVVAGLLDGKEPSTFIGQLAAMSLPLATSAIPRIDRPPEGSKEQQELKRAVIAMRTDEITEAQTFVVRLIARCSGASERTVRRRLQEDQSPNLPAD